MIVQRTLLGSGRKWAGPWRIRVDTMAGGTSNLTMTNYMSSSSSSYPILTDWGDGTHTVSKDIVSHTYASDGDYVISHYSLDNFTTALLLAHGGHKNIVEVLDPFPRLPSVGDGYSRTFYNDDYLQTIPPNLFDDNADFITDLGTTFYGIKGGPLHIPAGLFKSLTKLSNIFETFTRSVLDYIPDGLFEGVTTIADADYTFMEAKASYSGNRIFAGCTGLNCISKCFYNAEIPVFGDDIFNGCTGLTDKIAFTFTDIIHVKSVGARTFANCTGITGCAFNFTYSGSFKYPLELGSIGDYTWQNCTALEKTSFFLNRAPKLKVLPSHTFSGCTNLTDLSLMLQNEKDGSALGAMDLYLDCCPKSRHYPLFQGVPDMTATTQRVIHVPSGCTAASITYPNKYTVVADR
uniref:Leucine-rich repeat protein n=1 Tax=Podoviridae sp. ct2iq11 TaxID=2827720 RepID=A0A8S5TPI4_9CAUD|nr:MAG TPA: leucine-rich repeat protein [Podoviridae sp. ct2iq11]